jgi:hypothetical protein
VVTQLLRNWVTTVLAGQSYQDNRSPSAPLSRQDGQTLQILRSRKGAKLKLQIYCNECIKNFVDSGGKKLHHLKWANVLIQDDGIYEITCPIGHKSITTLSAEKFEILFEVGANAILDGYYREAVSSFASSLERFYEYFISIIALKSKVPAAEFETAWNAIKSQSERQLGAFTFLWLMEKQKAAPQLTNRMREFRNDVIHKGKIPSKIEVLIFGNSVLSILTEGVNEIRKNYEEFRCQLMGKRTMSLNLEKYNGQAIGGMGIRTIVSLVNKDHIPVDLETGLRNLETQREKLQSFELIQMLADRIKP